MKKLYLGLLCTTGVFPLASMDGLLVRTNDKKIEEITLCSAARDGNVGAVTALMESSSNRDREEALEEAAKNGHEAVVALLLQAGVEDVFSVLFKHLKEALPHKGVAERLFKALPEDQQGGALEGAVEKGHPELVKSFSCNMCDKGSCHWAFWAAIRLKKFVELQYILTAGVSDTAKIIGIKLAAENNDERSVGLILESGFENIFENDPTSYQALSRGGDLTQAIRLACIQGNDRIINMLKSFIQDMRKVVAFKEAIQGGFQKVDLNQIEQNCAFCHCVRINNKAEIEAFIRSGKSVDIAEGFKIAVEAGNEVMAAILIKVGVPEYIVRMQLLKALEKRCIKIISLIVQQSANYLKLCGTQIDNDDEEMMTVFICSNNKVDGDEEYKKKRSEGMLFIMERAIQSRAHKVLSIFITAHAELKNEALWRAVAQLNVPAVRFLLGLGVDHVSMNKAVLYIQSQIKSGDQSKADCLEIIKLFFKAGISDESKAAILNQARMQGALTIIKCMLELGVSDAVKKAFKEAAIRDQDAAVIALIKEIDGEVLIKLL